MIKKIVLYTVCLLPWFLGNLFPLDYGYYKEILKPSFAPPTYFYAIAWSIIYILTAYTIYSIVSSYKFKDIPKSYKISLLVNYLFNQGYTLVFFGLKSSFLGFIFCLGTLISCLLLYEETSLLQNKKKYYLLPYIGLSVFAVILSLSIYLLNI